MSRQLGHQRGQIVGPCGVGGRRWELRQQIADHLRPQAEGSRPPEVERGACCGTRPRSLRAEPQLGREPGLADPRLAAHHGHAAGPPDRRVPCPLELVELGVAAHE